MMKKKHKYFNQLFFTYSAAFLLFLTLLFIAVLGLLYREQYARNVEVHCQLVSQIQSQLDSSLEGMDRIINGLLFNKSFMEVMSDSPNASSTPVYDSQIQNYFLTMDAPDLSTYRIIAFNDDVYYTLTKSEENPAYIQKAIPNYPWAQLIRDSDGEKVILPAHPDSFSEYGAPVYSVARKITDGKNDYGIIEVQNEYKEISSICTLDNVSGEVMLFAPDGTQIYPAASDMEKHPAEFYQNVYATVSQEQTAENGSALLSGSFLKKGAQISYVTSDYSGWTAVLHCPALAMVPFGLQMILFSILIFLFLIGAVLLMFRILTRRMVAPLNDLNLALKEVSLDNLSLTLPQQYNIEEIENINQSFQKMFAHLKNAINVSIQSKTNEERANYLALQSQMNPHTIYNTISMIEGVTYMNGDLEASELCIRFSKMLRYISDYTKDTYSIQDEVSHLQNYAFLIQKRYDGKIDIPISVEDGLLGEAIPKFTLQPIVENCVQHGLRSSNHHFVVNVRIFQTEKGWKISIVDNGSGFSPESCQNITEQLKHCDEGLKNHKDIINRKIGNLAVSNIYMRCRILYGSRFHFAFGNNPESSGAFVEIEVCKKEEDGWPKNSTGGSND